jgi:hypothetical protein
VFECLINLSIVPYRSYGVKWMNSYKAANQFDNAQKFKRETA